MSTEGQAARKIAPDGPEAVAGENGAVQPAKTKKASHRRHRGARSDATVGGMLLRIADHYQLPEGCLRFVKPGGKVNYHPRAHIGTVRAEWDEAESS